MSLRATILLYAVAAYSISLASDSDIIEKWTSDIAAIIAQDLRSAFDQGVYADRLGGRDKNSVINQISSVQAACIVGAYVQLAESHSTTLEDVFVSPQKGLINTDLFSYEETHERTKDCARNAFNIAGIEYD